MNPADEIEAPHDGASGCARLACEGIPASIERRPGHGEMAVWTGEACKLTAARFDLSRRVYALGEQLGAKAQGDPSTPLAPVDESAETR